MTNPAVPPVPSEGHGVDFPHSAIGRALFWIAVVFSIFQIVTAAHVIDLSSQITRAFHVGFLMLLACLALGAKAFIDFWVAGRKGGMATLRRPASH